MPNRYRRGLIALSADPVHLGHVNLILQAAAQCDEIVVYISDNDQKAGSYLFSRSVRKGLVRNAMAGIPCKVIDGNGPLTDTYLREGCDVLFRGVRNAKDQAYEENQMFYFRMGLPTLNVVYIAADNRLAHISSTVVKLFVKHHFDTSDMVYLAVKAALEEEIHNQFRFGVTGLMGTGKSYTCERVRDILKTKRVGCTIINIDQLVRDLYAEDTPGAQLVRDNIASVAGTRALTEDGKDVDRDYLRTLFGVSGSSLMNDLAALNTPHIHRLMRDRLRPAEGIVLIEYATLAEDALSHLANNNVIVVDSANRDAYCEGRGTPIEFKDHCDSIVAPTAEKVAMLEHAADKSRYGTVLQFDNDGDNADFEGLARQIMTVHAGASHTAQTMKRMEF